MTVSRSVAPAAHGSEHPHENDVAAHRINVVVLAVFGVAFVAGLALWLLPLRSSFWLDETGTYWVVKNGLRSTLHRSWLVPSQSPIFYLVELAVVRTAGKSEALLRLPSLIATAVAVVYVWRIGKRLFGNAAGLTAAATLVSYETIRFAAADARPYGFAFLGAAASTFYLVRWFATGRTRDGVLYAVFAAFLIYSEYVFASILFVHLVYAFARRTRTPVTPRQVVQSLGLLLVFCAPIPIALVTLLRRSSTLQWAIGSTTVPVLLLVLSQPLIILGAGVMAGRIRGAPRPAQPGGDRSAVLLVAAWAAFPPVVNFLLSRFTSIQVFNPRYYMVAVPGIFLLVGWVIERARVPALGAALAVVLVVLAAHPLPRVHEEENWRSAVRSANALTTSANDPVIARINFIESSDVSNLRDPTTRSFITSPVDFYPLEGSLRILPYTFAGPNEAYAQGVIADATRGRSSVVCILDGAADTYVRLFRQLMGQAGFQVRQGRTFGGVSVLLFGRTVPA